jgi:uncharacterized protein YndB with AHSA1/START domain
MVEHRFQKTVEIQAPVDKVWEALTIPTLMKQWMTESSIDIITSWEKGSPFIIEGNLHGIVFQNKGVVLEYEPMHRLAYSHLSSISALPDELENYTVIDFTLTHGTILTIEINNFPTDAIYHHMAFYWNVAPEVLKKFVEQPGI